MKIVKAGKVLTSEALNAEIIIEENIRQSNELIRQQQQTVLSETISRADTAVQNSETATTNTINAMNSANLAEESRVLAENSRVIEFNTMKEQSFIIPQSPVATYTDIALTYTTPEIGWTVKTLDNGNIYRYDGTTWLWADNITSSSYDALLSQIGNINNLNTESKANLVESVCEVNSGLKVDSILNMSMPSLGKYAININTSRFPVLTANRIARKTYDREMLFFGDSHGWGQGAPDNDFGTSYSRYMTFPHNKGFFARLQKYIEDKYGFYTTSILPNAQQTTASPRIISKFSIYDKHGINKNSDCIHPVSGIYTSLSSNLVTPVSAKGFYNPGANADNALVNLGYLAMQNKLSKGMLLMAPESRYNSYKVINNFDYFELVPNGKYNPSTYIQYKSNGGIYYLHKEDLTVHYLHTAENILPDWCSVGSLLYIQGYGEVKVSVIAPLGSTVQGVNIAITNPDGTSIATDLSPYLYAGVKIYQSKIGKATFYVEMKESVRKIYIGAQRHPSGGKLEIYFSDENTGLEYLGITHNKSNRPNVFYPTLDGYPLVYEVIDGVDTLLSSPEVTIEANSIIIDTYNTTTSEVVYCIDYRQKQKGNLYFNYAGANASASNFSGEVGSAFNIPIIKLRGIIFGGNVVRNFSMGGRTVGKWLNDDGILHMDEILNYVPRTPTLCVVQAPIVNEYLLQTPIETFKSNLSAFVSKLNNHKNVAATKKTDFLFFTTIGDRTIEYKNGTSYTITYDMYFQAIKEFCVDNNYGFVDFHKYFKDSVDYNLINYDALYDNDIHPSPFVNEFIAKGLCTVIDLVM